MKPTRRQLLKAGVLTGAAAAIGLPQFLARSRATAATIDPTTIPLYQTPLFVLPAMPPSAVQPGWDQYSVAARPVTQQMLPPGFPATSMFAFGSTTARGSFHAPGYTIEATANRQTRVTWSNQLVNSSNGYVPPLLAVDPTLHWANPPGGTSGRDQAPVFTSTPGPYTGPVPLIVHLHGGHDYEESDGYPEAWFLPTANNIPAGYATVGSFYGQYKAEALSRWGVQWSPGSATFVYPNDQRATQLWYHDHSLGMVRVNVMSGLAGYYILRGGQYDLPPGVLPGPAPKAGDPAGTNYYEIPLIFTNPTFNTDGSLYFPDSRSDFGDTTGPYIPETDIPPIWNPVFFGTTMVVNGNTWPYLNVEPRRYRFRLLNSTNVSTLALKVVSDPLATRPATAALPIWVIGSDGGLLPAPTSVDSLPVYTSERYDIIIDFTGLTPGTELYLSNEGFPSTPATTGQLMQFRVVPLKGQDLSVPPSQLTLPSFQVAASTNTRNLSTNLVESTFQPTVVAALMLGTVNADGTPNLLSWDDPMTETPAYGTTETWNIWNFATDNHEFHIHLVQFQVISRQAFNGGTVTPPNSWETGPKDSVFCPTGQITSVRATFDRRSRYVWHCHFMDHEDNNMMRPYQVV